MEEKYREHFTETPRISFELLHKTKDCKEFLLHNGVVFYLSNRNTLVVPSENEEYEFYGNVVKIGIYGQYIYLIFECSKIIVFDALEREVVTNFSGGQNKINRVRIVDSKIHFLCDDGCLYKSSFENLRYFKHEFHSNGSKPMNHVIMNFGIDDESVFFATNMGAIHRNSELILKVFDTVELMASWKGHLYVLTSKGLLVKYDLMKSRIIFRLNMGKVSVIGESVIVLEGIAIDLLNETWTKIPKDIQSIVKEKEGLYIQTLSGIWGN